MIVASDQMNVWTQPLEGTQLHISIVVDQPDTMTYVTQAMVADSGQAGEHWLHLALDNLRKLTQTDCLEVVHSESGMRMCHKGDAYDASRALILDHICPAMPKAGCLVAVPSRDELFVLPLTVESFPHLHLLKIVSDKSYKSAPYSLTDQVFWVCNHQWQPLPIQVREDEIVLHPPKDLLEVFKEMSDNQGKDEV
jgi:hypothetical protein